MEYVDRWKEEMSAIRLKVAPEPYVPTEDWSDYLLDEFWCNFLSACVLYDPPDDQLIEFASYIRLKPTDLYDGWNPNKRNPEMFPEMVDPPVKSLWALTELRDWYWKRILDYIGERYLEPQGVDIENLPEDIVSEVPGLPEEHREKY